MILIKKLINKELSADEISLVSGGKKKKSKLPAAGVLIGSAVWAPGNYKDEFLR